jgi:hypothetical protein
MQANKLFLALAGGAALMVAGSAMAQIAQTKHNLGTGNTTWNGNIGTGNAATDEICVFCHTPHGADTNAPAPLWNRKLPTTTYKTYNQLGTSTLDGEVLAVGSVSLACLSCHDGSQAFNAVRNAPGSGGFMNDPSTATAGFQFDPTAGADNFKEFDTMPTSGGDAILNLGNNLGLNQTNGDDLRDDHPVGIAYCGGGPNVATPAGACADADFTAPTSGTINGTLQFWVDNGGAGRQKTDFTLYVRNFSGGDGPSVECASCHDPHLNNVTFLRVPNGTANAQGSGKSGNPGSRVCLACHTK